MRLIKILFIIFRLIGRAYTGNILQKLLTYMYAMEIHLNLEQVVLIMFIEFLQFM